ncbi:MAG: TrmB family transcriptional regulator [Coprococcus sp.]
MSYIDDLMQFGLTRQESSIYYSLLSEGMMTGYEAAKASGVSRSNTYTALAALVDKGAAYVAEGTPTRYVPVSVEEFCGNKLDYLRNLSERLVEQQPRAHDDDEAYITISGFQNICQKAGHMLDGARYRIYMTGSAAMLEMFREKLEHLIERRIKVVLITEPPFKLQGAIIYHSDEIADRQIGLIVDSVNVLTGDLVRNENCSCLYSGKKNLIDLFKQSLSRQIQLIELRQNKKGSCEQ